MSPPPAFDRASRASRLALVTEVIPALIYVLVLFYAGLIRLGPLPQVGDVPSDKVLHTLTFGGLTWLLLRASRFWLPAIPFRIRLLTSVALASLLGALLEVCQAFTSYRSAEFLDWVADTVGAGLCALLLALVARHTPWRSNG